MLSFNYIDTDSVLRNVSLTSKLKYILRGLPQGKGVVIHSRSQLVIARRLAKKMNISIRAVKLLSGGWIISLKNVSK